MKDGISDSKIAEYFALTTYELEKGTSVRTEGVEEMRTKVGSAEDETRKS